MKLPIVTSETIEKITKWKELVKKDGSHHAYVRVSDARKMGRRYIYFCHKQKRIVHLLSSGEYRAYQNLIWLPSTLEIREQMPLDLNITLRLSAELGFIHPRDWKENTAHVMSTDFLVLTMNPVTQKKYHTAYSFKYSNQLFKKIGGKFERKNLRTWQKLAIEKSYWNEKGIDYRIITELDAPKSLAANIDWFKTEHAQVSPAEMETFSLLFIESWKTNRRLSIEEHLQFIVKRLSITFNRAQSIFKYVALHKILPLNLASRLTLQSPVVLEL